MFELSVACKYLLPRRRQLSVSIISLISVLVITLVVWLIVVFFSVTDGLERSWLQKLTTLTAPVRIIPTEAYYNSYYYQIDSISAAASYNLKTIREKNESTTTVAYDSEQDEEIPSYWPSPDENTQGQVKDLVKLVYASIDHLQGVSDVKTQDFELTASQINLRFLRAIEAPLFLRPYTGSTQAALSYPAYLTNFESDNPFLNKILLPVQPDDMSNIFQTLALASYPLEGEEEDPPLLSSPLLQQRLSFFFEQILVTRLKTRSTGWMIPQFLLPGEAEWVVCALIKGDTPLRLMIPSNMEEIETLKMLISEDSSLKLSVGKILLTPQKLILELPSQPPRSLPRHTPLILFGGVDFPAQLVKESIQNAKRPEEVKFEVELPIQNSILRGVIPYRGLSISTFTLNPLSSAQTPPLWIDRNYRQEKNTSFSLPQDLYMGEGVLVPKNFRETGALIGDRGYLTYYAPTTSILQEQHIPIYVAGFYDPGIIPIGGKFILANREVISIIRASHNADDRNERIPTNGINVRFPQFQKAGSVKDQLVQALKKEGISRYWNVETYREYDFTKEIIQELQSQKNIFSLIAIVIIIVACSNIISMLVILVNDKKVEIGILRSMGASSKSIALIFGLAGGAIGIMGSLLGIGAALFTLNHLQFLIGFISRVQGYDMFNSAFYGEALPQELSYEALLFVSIATVAISLLAGIVPAVKACLLRPSTILRSTG